MDSETLDSNPNGPLEELESFSYGFPAMLLDLGVSKLWCYEKSSPVPGYDQAGHFACVESFLRGCSEMFYTINLGMGRWRFRICIDNAMLFTRLVQAVVMDIGK